LFKNSHLRSVIFPHLFFISSRSLRALSKYSLFSFKHTLKPFKAHTYSSFLMVVINVFSMHKNTSFLHLSHCSKNVQIERKLLTFKSFCGIIMMFLQRAMCCNLNGFYTK
jgi:hypothetical protein